MADQVDQLLAQFKGERADAIHQALRTLDARTSQLKIVVAELMAEVVECGHWKKVKAANGTKRWGRYETYFFDTLGMKRAHVYNFIRVGRTIRETPAKYRAAYRAKLAELGIARAVQLVPALVTPQRDEWMARAKSLGFWALRREIATAFPKAPSEARGGQPARKRLLSHLGQLGVSPALIEEFVEAAREHVGTDDPKEVLTCALQDVMVLWRS